MQGHCELKYKCFTLFFYLGVWLHNLSPSAAVWGVTSAMSKEPGQSRAWEKLFTATVAPATLWGESKFIFGVFAVERTVVLLLIVHVRSQKNQFPSLMYQAGEQHEAFALENPVFLRHCQPLCPPRKASGQTCSSSRKIISIEDFNAFVPVNEFAFPGMGFYSSKSLLCFFALPTDTYFYLHDLTINQPKLTFWATSARIYVVVCSAFCSLMPAQASKWPRIQLSLWRV